MTASEKKRRENASFFTEKTEHSAADTRVECSVFDSDRRYSFITQSCGSGAVPH